MGEIEGVRRNEAGEKTLFCGFGTQGANPPPPEIPISPGGGVEEISPDLSQFAEEAGERIAPGLLLSA